MPRAVRDSPGSDPRFTIEDHIERHEIDYAVLVGEPTQLEISNLANAEAAAALSAAYNDRLIETWLCPWITATSGRSTSPPRPADLAALEIDRVGGHPQMVQVILGAGSRAPYGQRQFHPIAPPAAAKNNRLWTGTS